jgi:hypothetical protein
LLLKGMRDRLILQYSDYKKFTVSTVETTKSAGFK